MKSFMKNPVNDKIAQARSSGTVQCWTLMSTQRR